MDFLKEQIKKRIIVNCDETKYRYELGKRCLDDLVDEINDVFEKNKIQEKDQRIAELEKELADLKQNAIVPKFKSGSSLFSIKDNSWVCPQENCVPVLFNNKIYYAFYIENEDDLIYNYGMEQNLIREENLFATKEEAEEKLNQMKWE